ncbi:MAG: alpha/beta hydrolase [Cyanobacteria bacterium REEB67]|nr:alpha/beta hydrolase [Cyanobacteria bacterium REEB67]
MSRLFLLPLLLVGLLGGILQLPPVTGAFGQYPLLFLSERKDLHIGTRRAHSNFFKVVQGDQYTYGMRSEGGDEIFDRDQFYDRLDKARQVSGNAPIVIFVHGCCVSFGEQLLQANDLKKAINTSYARAPSEGAGAPVVLTYDWAAPFSYNTSLENCYVAQSRFEDFMRGMVGRYGSDKIVIVAHSLGTLMVQNYARHIEDSPEQAPFQAIIFSRADVDRDAFAECLPALKKYSKRLVVISSHNDPNLYFSGMLRKVGIKFAQAATLPATLPVRLPAKLPGARLKKERDTEAKSVEDKTDEVAEKAVLIEQPKSPKVNLRLGQTKVARNFASSVEVYDMSALRIGHGIPYKFVGDLLFHDLEDFDMKKSSGGVLVVHGARP